jgi:hypothetical protein
MKIGDMVSTKHHRTGETFTGLVVAGPWQGEAQVFWDDGMVQWELTESLEVISERG